MEKGIKKPLLTISLLASDRPDTIRRCLDSLQPIREAIPCELIIVDTSRNPFVHDILLEYTKQVYEFEWCNDFAKARNVGLKEAKGEWFLYLDDDEWFADSKELIRFFQTREYMQYGYANYQVRNFLDEKYTYYSDCWVSRMIRIEKDTQFVSKIHEYFEPIRGKRKDLYAMVYHTGYIYETEEKRRKHFERNCSLLLEMIKEEPDNLRWQTQLVQEYSMMKEWGVLVDYCKKCLETAMSINSSYENVLLGTFYAGYTEGLTYQKKYVESIEACQQALNDKRSTQLLKALMHLRLGENYFRLAEWEKAKNFIQTYLQEYQVLNQNEQLMLKQKMALKVDETFDDTNRKKAYSILICCDLKLGNIKTLCQFYDKLEWNKPVIYALEEIECFLVEAMATMEYHTIFGRIVTDAYRNKELRKLMSDEAGRWEARNNKGFQKIMYAYAKAQSEDWFIWYARIRNAVYEENETEIIEAVNRFFETVPNVLAVSQKVYEIALTYGSDFSQMWKKASANQWKENVREYVSQADIDHLNMTRERVKNVFGRESWRYRFFMLEVMERDVIEGPKEFWNINCYYETLKSYAEATLEFYQFYYRKEVFFEYPEALPKNVQAAVKLMNYVQLEQDGAEGALKELKESAEICPKFAEGVCRFLKLYPDFEKQREKENKWEMKALRDRIIVQAKDLLEKEQNEDALAVANQLKQMMPEDLDVETLVLEARLATLKE